jgi:uncharacterized spore protein YtfJ
VIDDEFSTTFPIDLDRLQTSANVKTVYGDAITAEGKTIISE